MESRVKSYKALYLEQVSINERLKDHVKRLNQQLKEAKAEVDRPLELIETYEIKKAYADAASSYETARMYRQEFDLLKEQYDKLFITMDRELTEHRWKEQNCK